MATDVAPQVRPEPHAPFLRRPEAWLVLVVVVGLAIRLYRLDERSIWFDEASSWRTVQFPLGEMIDRVAANCHPPLYYLCLKVWTALFGDSLWAMRGLSVLFASVLMVGTYLFMRALCELGDGTSIGKANRGGGGWTGVVAAALVATSAFQIRMSWEARMYMLGAALAVLSSWLLLVAWRRTDSLRLWMLYGLSALFLAYTHYYGLFTIFAQYLFLAIALAGGQRGGVRAFVGQPRVRGTGLSLVVVTLGFSPWLPTFVAQRQQIDEEWWTGTFRFESLLGVSQTMLVGEGGRGWLAVVAACVIVAIVALLLARGKLYETYLGLLILCPVMISVVYSLEFRNIIVDRYFVFTQVFVLCGAAMLLARIPAVVIRSAAAILLVVWSVIAYCDMWTRLDIRNRPGAQRAAAHILSRGEVDEPVIVSSSIVYYPMLYHLRGERECRLVQTEALVHHVGGPFSMPNDFITVGEVDQLHEGRAWLVTGGWGDRPLDIPAHWSVIRSDTFREVFSFQRSVTVHEYRIDSTP
jgi:hypothetical protein